MIDETSDKVKNSEEVTVTAHGKARRRLLVDKAYELIAESGFERLRTREVAERVGVNVATLHYYFRTKEDLILGVADRLFEELSTVHDPSARKEADTPLTELRKEFSDVSYQTKEKPQTFVVLFELYLRSLRDQSIRDIFAELDIRWHNHIEAYLTDGVQQKLFRSNLDIPAATSGLMAFIKGAILQTMINPRSFPADRVYAEMERWIIVNVSSTEPD